MASSVRVTTPPVPLEQFVGVRGTFCISGRIPTRLRCLSVAGPIRVLFLITRFTAPEVTIPKPAPAKFRPAKHPPAMPAIIANQVVMTIPPKAPSRLRLHSLKVRKVQAE